MLNLWIPLNEMNVSSKTEKARELIYWKVIIGREDKTQWDRFSLSLSVSLTLTLSFEQRFHSFVQQTFSALLTQSKDKTLETYALRARSLANANAVNVEKFIDGFCFLLSQTWAHKRTISEILHLKRKTKTKTNWKYNECVKIVNKLQMPWVLNYFRSEKERKSKRKRNRIFH